MDSFAMPARGDSFALSPDLDAPAEARRRAIRAAGGCGGPAGDGTLGLLVSEVVTNAVVHGGDGGDLDVSVRLGDGRVRVEVSDGGDGFASHPHALDADAMGGWGLHVVQQLAAGWGVSCGDRTTVWFELLCARDGAKAVPASF